MSSKNRLITIEGLRLGLNEHIEKVFGVLENSSEMCTDHAVSLYSAITTGIKLKLFSSNQSDTDSSRRNSSSTEGDACHSLNDSTELKTDRGPLRVPSSELHLRQLGDQMYGNRMRLQQTIPLTPPSPRCTSSSPTTKTKPSHRSGRFKKFSLSRHRNRKTSKPSDSPDQDFDVGAFATHLMAENCLGNLKVTGSNLRRKDVNETKNSSQSFDSGLLALSIGSSGSGRQRYTRESLGSAMVRHSLVPRSDSHLSVPDRNKITRSTSFKY